MASTLFQVDTVVLGRFNPHIITPEWLKREGILDTDFGEVLAVMTGKEVAFEFKTGQYRWHVDYGRLVIASEAATADPASLAARVIERLPHTPLTALGNNFHYRSPANRWSGGLPTLGKLGFAMLGAQGRVLQVTWGFKIECQPGKLIGLTTEQTEETVQVHVNFHNEVADKEQAIAAANRFAEDKKAGQLLLSETIGESVVE